MNYLEELKDEIKAILAKDNLAKIVISNDNFEATFFEKVAKTKTEVSALDKLYESPPSQEAIKAELEERNKKLREKFSNQGNVMPTSGVATWSDNK